MLGIPAITAAATTGHLSTVAACLTAATTAIIWRIVRCIARRHIGRPFATNGTAATVAHILAAEAAVGAGNGEVILSKDIGILVPLPPDVKAWAEAQAEDIGLNAANVGVWIRMLVHREWKRCNAPKISKAEYEAVSVFPSLLANTATTDDDAWRGPVDDEQGDAVSTVDVDAIIAARVAEASSAGLTDPAPQPYEAFGPPAPAATSGNVRSLRRPPPQFAAVSQPNHLRNL